MSRLLVLMMALMAISACVTYLAPPRQRTEEQAAYVICVANGQTVYQTNVRDWHELPDGSWQFVEYGGQVRYVTADCILNNPR